MLSRGRDWLEAPNEAGDAATASHSTTVGLSCFTPSAAAQPYTLGIAHPPWLATAGFGFGAVREAAWEEGWRSTDRKAASYLSYYAVLPRATTRIVVVVIAGGEMLPPASRGSCLVLGPGRLLMRSVFIAGVASAVR